MKMTTAGEKRSPIAAPWGSTIMIKPKSQWFREQAERCLRLARSLSNEADAKRLRRLGEDYLKQAQRAEEEGR
jgi:hypothetical protein